MSSSRSNSTAPSSHDDLDAYKWLDSMEGVPVVSAKTGLEDSEEERQAWSDRMRQAFETFGF